MSSRVLAATAAMRCTASLHLRAHALEALPRLWRAGLPHLQRRRVQAPHQPHELVRLLAKRDVPALVRQERVRQLLHARLDGDGRAHPRAPEVRRASRRAGGRHTAPPQSAGPASRRAQRQSTATTPGRSPAASAPGARTPEARTGPRCPTPSPPSRTLPWLARAPSEKPRAGADAQQTPSLQRAKRKPLTTTCSTIMFFLPQHMVGEGSGCPQSGGDGRRDVLTVFNESTGEYCNGFHI